MENVKNGLISEKYDLKYVVTMIEAWKQTYNK